MTIAAVPDQSGLVGTARSFLEAEFPAAYLRSTWDGGTDLRTAWRALAEVGFLGVPVAERFGGLGLGLVETVPLLEEAGRVALPGPLMETILSGWILTEEGTEEQKRRWLPGITDGSLIATVAVDSHPYVSHAEQADFILWCRGPELHVLPRDSFTATAVRSNDHSRSLAKVTPALSPETKVASSGLTAERSVDGAAVLTAAFLNGVSSHLLTASVAYAKERRQFGRPIGSFQAIQHRLAESHVAIEFARPTAWEAAHLLQINDPNAGTACGVAKICACTAAAKTNDDALQCHGGVGFTWEHDLHMWLKRGKALEHAYGSARWHRDRLSRGLFTTPPA